MAEREARATAQNAAMSPAQTRQSPKAPQDVDRHIGARVRVRRMIIGMSQSELAREAGGITFQQIQKYEKGTNRIGAGRLHRIAQVLGVPVQYFYDGAPSADDASQPVAFELHSAAAAEITGTSDGINLIKAFLAIEDAEARRRLVHTAQALADADT